MTLLLSADSLAARRQALSVPEALGGLAASLQRELYAALTVPVPEGKSRLTRHGGRCVHCTVLLTFDPVQPAAHTCPTCGVVYTDQVHHEWWLMNAHLWTAEQCTRAAALSALCDDERAAARSDEILTTYADRYLAWPNRDNALGPTRPFFSTYLESIWLLHLCVALDLREQSAQGMPRGLGGVVRERLIAPSAHLIASFPEGRSNREVWHCAARLAAAGLLGDDALRGRAAESLRHLLRTGLHTDGSWYEGENYHLFAHRGLLSAVTLAERAGVELPLELVQRFAAGFSAPFRTMFPDGTFPARRDSQYGISLRQYRTADWLECGLARHDTPELRAALAMMYDPTFAPGETGRSTSTADAEHNQRGVRLARADCSWRALLLARLDLPPLTDAVAHSELLEGQGLAVFRRNAGRFWVGLDYGDPGAGHGHPDRLNLVIADQSARWLDDVGTGSYTSPTLAWYRSSLAHNAPMVDGKDQGAAAGILLAHDEQQDAGWVSAEFIDPLSGVRVRRTVVVMLRYLIDEVTWMSEQDVDFDVPLQARGEHTQPAWRPATTIVGSEWLSDVHEAAIRGETVTPLLLDCLPSPARHTEQWQTSFTCLLWSDAPATLWRARTIGPPGGRAHGLVSLRQHGRRGRSVRVFASPEVLAELKVDAAGIDISCFPVDLERGGLGTRTLHRRTEDGWSVQSIGPDATPPIELRGMRRADALQHTPASPVAVAPPAIPLRRHGEFAASFAGVECYRPTEATWTEAGSPGASLQLRRSPTGITIGVRASLHREPVFAAVVAENPLDNEPADTNSDGVQLHWRSAVTGKWNSVIAVPDGAGVRLTVAEGTLDGLTATWEEIDRGFSVEFELPWPLAASQFVLDCCVNERPSGRERRRGQLVLSGANGESAYLRGARQGPERAVTIVFQHPSS